MTDEQRLRIVSESPLHGPALLAEFDALREALERIANRMTRSDDESGWQGAAMDMREIAEVAVGGLEAK